jgi:uncharacterized protein YegL
MEKYSKKQKVFNLIVLDESGSMSAIEKQAVGGVNETLQTISNAQREHAEQEHFVSFVTFNSNGIRTVMNRKQVEGGKALKWTDYQPNACTPLYDAMGQSINRLKKHVTEEDVVLVTIITDGMENASREYSGSDIKRLVSEMKERGWVFAYIGTNQDVDAVADSMGIRSRMNYEYSQTGAEDMFNVEHCRRSVFYSKLANEGKEFMRKKDFDFFEDAKRKEEETLEPKSDEPETNEKSQGFWGKFKNWLDKE